MEWEDMGSAKAGSTTERATRTDVQSAGWESIYASITDADVE